jgi:hypothetical protein
MCANALVTAPPTCSIGMVQGQVRVSLSGLPVSCAVPGPFNMALDQNINRLVASSSGAQQEGAGFLRLVRMVGHRSLHNANGVTVQTRQI